MTRLIHISDTHGEFPPIPDLDGIVVHSGDMLPNANPRNRAFEETWQVQWVRDRADEFRAWLRGRPMIWIPGNHDFANPGAIDDALRGLDVEHCVRRSIVRDGLSFYGEPAVPAICGIWNHETTEVGLRALAEMILTAKPDVLIAHSPPYGILDRAFGDVRAGNRALAKILHHGFAPRAVLCGHIHEASGLRVRGETIVSNAARAVHVIEL